MRKVWVANNKGHNLEPAKEFGKIILLTEGQVNIFAVDRHLANFKRQLATSMPDDFILVCGSTVLNMLLESIMMQWHDRVNLLMFDLKQSRYLARYYSREDLLVR